VSAQKNVVGLTAVTALIDGTVLMAMVLLCALSPRAVADPPRSYARQPLPNAAQPELPSSPAPDFSPASCSNPAPDSRHASWSAAAQPISAATYMDFSLHDAARDKDLPVRVHFPAAQDAKPLPIIIFSHGMGGSRDVAPELMEYWAGHGFAVFCPTHEDSVKLRRKDGQSLDPQEMLLEFGMDDDKRVSRVEDDQLILDSLAEVERQVPELAGRLDAEHVGIGGHSAGAMTAMLLAGAKNNLPSGEKQHSFREPRFKCALVLSGQGVGQAGFKQSSWAGIAIPLMVMTGSEDYTITKTDPLRRCDPYTFAPAGGKYLLYFDGAVHSSFVGGAAELQRAAQSYDGLSWRQQAALKFKGESLDTILAVDQVAIFDAVEQASLAFWEANLKGDSQAQAWLSSEAPARELTSALHYSHK
jgi:predicted dienelactone hydrolase